MRRFLKENWPLVVALLIAAALFVLLVSVMYGCEQASEPLGPVFAAPEGAE